MQKETFFREARRDLPGPLAGLRVLEVTTTWAGPMCGCVMADMGADVIKVELPEGEVSRRLPPLLPGTERPLSFMHTTVNRNKRSLTLDLRTEPGREICRTLAREVDVFVENFRPGILAGWGLGWADLRDIKADLVYVSISGFGQFGPESERAGYDPVAQAAGGYISLNGEPGGRPVKSPTFIADDLGGMHAALAALGALRHRDRTGEGQHVDVSLLDALLFQSNGYLTLGARGGPMPRMGSQFVVAAPANVYPCADGFVMAGVLLDSHWKVLASVMERPELGDDPRYATTGERVSRRDEVNAILAEWIAPRTKREIVDRLVAHGLPVSPVQTYAEAAADPHVQERDMLQRVVAEDGTEIPLTGPAAKFSRTPTRVRTAAPALGQHTDEILAEIGIGRDEIEGLREQGVV